MKLCDREQAFGLGYTLFSIFFLPAVLQYIPFSSLWLNFSYYALNFLVLGWLLRRFLKKSVICAGKNVLKLVLYPMAGFVAYWFCNFLFSWLTVWIYPDFSNRNDAQVIDLLAQNPALMTLSTVILVPFAEELMHRALVFGSLYRRHKAAAYAVSALFFAIIHVMGYVGTAPVPALLLSTLQYIPAGLILAWCYQKSGCIFAPMFLHAAINAMGILALR